MAEDAISIRQRTCQTCGMLLRDAGEFHPLAFCVWKKAGLDPWETLAWVCARLGMGEPPMHARIRDLPECHAPMTQRLAVDHLVSFKPRVCHLPEGHEGPHSFKAGLGEVEGGH